MTMRPPRVEEPLSIGVDAPSGPLAFGAPFPLTIRLRWDATLHTPTWTDESLAPLVVEAVSVEQSLLDGWTEEVRVYRARSFLWMDARVPALDVSARRQEGGESVRAHHDAVPLEITPQLDASEPGTPELPGPPLLGTLPGEPTTSYAPLVAACVGAALCVGLFVAWWRGRRRRVPTPEAVLLTSLRHLDQDASLSGETFAVALAEVLRRYAAARWRCPRAWSTEQLMEILTSRDAVSQRDREDVAAVLRGCDGIKFARQPLTPSARSRWCERVKQLASSTKTST